MPRVLHVLAQRPGRTGSGVTLDALVRETTLAGGWEQHALVGVPVGDEPEVGDLTKDQIDTVRFGPGGDLPFAVPGMSDVMPYESTVFSSMPATWIDSYCATWVDALRRVAARFQPDVIHVHHIWLLGALVKDALPHIPVIGHCHATGLRQMELTPGLAERVRRGNARNNAFVVLHEDHATRLADTLALDPARIHVVGAGFRDDVFPCRERIERRPERLVYVGKLSDAKGVGELLDAVERLSTLRPGLQLHMAGGGNGAEAERLRARCATLGERVIHHGIVSDLELARLMQSASVLVLPSYYEGLPLVLVEAAASACRLVATALPGVRSSLAPPLGESLTLVPLPEMASIDQPTPEGRRAFVESLERALLIALDAPALDPAQLDLDALRWGAVAARVRRVWEQVLRSIPDVR